MNTNILSQAALLQKFQALFVSLVIGLVGLALGGVVGHIVVAFAVLLRVSREPVPETEARQVLPLQKTRKQPRGYVINSASLVGA